jgi:HEPN domain-containing protein
MDLASLRRRIEDEMALAQQAHSAGREGRARVCARRAAGLAAAHHLEGRGQSPRASSAYDALRRVAESDGLPPELRRAAGRLTARVTEDFVLPHREDPLADARAVIEACLASAENR